MTISAKVIKDSINPQGVRITTLELEYPRIIHAELLVHRVFSRNSASSRAIPVNKMIEMIESNPAMPVHWGKNQPGMQAREELSELDKEAVKALWLESARQAVSIARVMNSIGAHKQVINRILEPFQHMKVVLTSTEWNNWDWLRLHEDADPTIQALAVEIKKARDESTPILLKPNEWHMPYVKSEKDGRTGKQFFTTADNDEEYGEVLTVETALKISSSCCAQVSYRKADDTLTKAEVIYSKLIESEPCHSSPCEHQAMVPAFNDLIWWHDGVTHEDVNGNCWSGNFRSWIQHRQLIPNNAKF